MTIKMPTHEGKLTLEQAREVLNAHRDAEREVERQERLALVGRYFKYWNNYGVGGKTSGWWLYAQVTGVDELAWATGRAFQISEDGNVEVMTSRACATIKKGTKSYDGWTEITAADFWKAWRQTQREINRVMKRGGRAKLRRLRQGGGR